VVPTVTSVITFASLIETPANNCLMFSERDGDSFVKASQELVADANQITVLVGSEGGWSDEEIAAARAAGWKVITLGGRTLRAETAAIAVTTLLQHRFGDLS
jgi:16S rRNA (uracil1498-N3)-methyltransferase